MCTQNEFVVDFIIQIEEMKILYRNIEAERARNSMTQEELSKKIGITRKTYYIKQRNESFTSDELIKLSQIFKCSIDYLSKKLESEV